MNTILDNIFNLTCLALIIYLIIRFLVSKHELYRLIMADEATIVTDNGYILIRKIRFTDLIFKMVAISVMVTVLLAAFGMNLTGMYIFSIVMNSVVISVVASASMNSKIMAANRYIQEQSGLLVRHY
jgi:hypothetical protein